MTTQWEWAGTASTASGGKSGNCRASAAAALLNSVRWG